MTVLLLLAVAVSSLASAVVGEDVPACDDRCHLPYCYCETSKIPGGLQRSDTPQMVLFTFNDPVTGNVRKKLIDLFPDRLKNPATGCPITITLFVVGSGTDYCAVHRLYVRGHEVASGGQNRTGQTEDWTAVDWENLFVKHHETMVDKAYLPDGHVRGARAPLQKPGGDNHFSVLYERGFRYDATLLGGTGTLDSDKPNPWPGTLDVIYKPCLTPKCPTKAYNGLWEIPIVRLANPTTGRPCAYLDACIVGMKSSKDVYNLLYTNFRFAYESNRAPMQINMQTKTLRNKVAVEGIRLFIKKIMSDDHDDTWILTIHELLEWMESPTAIGNIAESDIWSCDDRNYHKCSLEEGDEAGGRRDRPPSPFREILFVDQLWLFQAVVLVISYIIVRKYDKAKN